MLHFRWSWKEPAVEGSRECVPHDPWSGPGDAYAVRTSSRQIPVVWPWAESYPHSSGRRARRRARAPAPEGVGVCNSINIPPHTHTHKTQTQHVQKRQTTDKNTDWSLVQHSPPASVNICYYTLSKCKNAVFY